MSVFIFRGRMRLFPPNPTIICGTLFSASAAEHKELSLKENTVYFFLSLSFSTFSFGR